MYDLAYRGKTAAVKILLNENEKLKTQTDNVCIMRRCATVLFVYRVRFLYIVEVILSFPFLAEWSNVDTLGGLGWSR